MDFIPYQRGQVFEVFDGQNSEYYCVFRKHEDIFYNVVLAVPLKQLDENISSEQKTSLLPVSARESINTAKRGIRIARRLQFYVDTKNPQLVDVHKLLSSFEEKPDINFIGEMEDESFTALSLRMNKHFLNCKNDALNAFLAITHQEWRGEFRPNAVYAFKEFFEGTHKMAVADELEAQEMTRRQIQAVMYTFDLNTIEAIQAIRKGLDLADLSAKERQELREIASRMEAETTNIEFQVYKNSTSLNDILRQYPPGIPLDDRINFERALTTKNDERIFFDRALQMAKENPLSLTESLYFRFDYSDWDKPTRKPFEETHKPITKKQAQLIAKRLLQIEAYLEINRTKIMAEVAQAEKDAAEKQKAVPNTTKTTLSEIIYDGKHKDRDSAVHTLQDDTKIKGNAPPPETRADGITIANAIEMGLFAPNGDETYNFPSILSKPQDGAPTSLFQAYQMVTKDPRSLTKRFASVGPRMSEVIARKIIAVAEEQLAL